MTSSVKVTAHCGDNKKVVISLNGKVDTVLVDGESVELYVYDERELSVKEELKETLTE